MAFKYLNTMPYSVAIKKNTTWGSVIKQINENSVVLDIGCYDGYVGKYLIENKACTFYGVDINEEALEEAGKFYSEAICADLEKTDLLGLFNTKFDYIILADVLEHLKNPEQILEKARQLLKPSGEIIISFPNVAYWKIRLFLLFGLFDEKVSDILSHEHLHYFTFDGIISFLEKIDFNMISYVSAGNNMPIFLRKLFPKLFTAQFVLTIKPRSRK